MHVRTRVLVLTAVLLLVAGCGSSGKKDVRAEPSGSPSYSSTGGPMPTKVPPASGSMRTRGAVTILDDGDGPELCLGGVMTSLPPQCGGPTVVNWAWADHRGDFEDVSGVRWGEFAVTGTFDGTSFEPTRIVPLEEYDGPAGRSDDVDLSTPCPPPSGGWRVLDRARTTDETMSATLEAASKLRGYAGAWLDQSRNPASGSSDEESGMNDPTKLTLNIRVTGDLASAEAELRKTWGGALCVSKAQHTEAELSRIQDELTKLPGMLSAGGSFDVVDVEVIHDDGSLQAWADAVYGPGVVRISSALVPASG